MSCRIFRARLGGAEKQEYRLSPVECHQEGVGIGLFLGWHRGCGFDGPCGGGCCFAITAFTVDLGFLAKYPLQYPRGMANIRALPSGSTNRGIVPGLVLIPLTYPVAMR